MPAVTTPDVPGWPWRKQTNPGEVIEGIVETARPGEADPVVMCIDGRHAFLDAFRGSHISRRQLQPARRACSTESAFRAVITLRSAAVGEYFGSTNPASRK